MIKMVMLVITVVVGDRVDVMIKIMVMLVIMVVVVKV